MSLHFIYFSWWLFSIFFHVYILVLTTTTTTTTLAFHTTTPLITNNNPKQRTMIMSSPPVFSSKDALLLSLKSTTTNDDETTTTTSTSAETIATTIERPFPADDLSTYMMKDDDTKYFSSNNNSNSSSSSSNNNKNRSLSSSSSSSSKLTRSLASWLIFQFYFVLREEEDEQLILSEEEKDFISSKKQKKVFVKSMMICQLMFLRKKFGYFSELQKLCNMNNTNIRKKQPFNDNNCDSSSSSSSSIVVSPDITAKAIDTIVKIATTSSTFTSTFTTTDEDYDNIGRNLQELNSNNNNIIMDCNNNESSPIEFQFMDMGIPEFQPLIDIDNCKNTTTTADDEYKLVIDIDSKLCLRAEEDDATVEDGNDVPIQSTPVVSLDTGAADGDFIPPTNNEITLQKEASIVIDDTINNNKEVSLEEVPIILDDNQNQAATSAESTTTTTNPGSAPRPFGGGDDDEGSIVASFRKKSSQIVHSFQQEDFKPAFFAKNSDLQTILGVIGRQKNMYFPPSIRKSIDEFQWDERQRFNTTTSSGSTEEDFFDVDWKFADNRQTVARPSSEIPLVVICHGLQSSSDSPLCKDMALAFNQIGMDVACINFRGCSGEPNLTPMGYHLSFTDDLEQFVSYISAGEERPDAPIYLSGFSLGANVVTKFLSDQGIDAYRKYNICGAAVNAVPFNLTAITSNLNRPGFRKTLYGNRLRDSLVERIESTYDEHDHPFTLDELRSCATINEFEDLVLPTAYNFTGVHDYLTKSSVAGIIDGVMVPELIIQAMDDPFMQGNTNPANNPESPLRIQYTEFGGHCGYVFHTKEDGVDTDSSWLPMQMARFIDHVHKTGNLQANENAFREISALTTSETPFGRPTSSVVTKLTPSNWRSWATSISQAFQSTEFKPAWFATDNHFQTIMGTLAREEVMYYPSNWFSTKKWSGQLSAFRWDQRQRLETRDGDFFDVDFKFLGSTRGNTLEWDDRPIVLICHGLESNSDSPLAKDMAKAFNNVGLHAACINFRGCSGEPNRTPVAYHLGFTDDLKQTIKYINTRYPNKRIYLSGFSLGANVVTTYLTGMGDKAIIDHNVIGAAVNAVPFDMPKSNRNLNEDGLTKSLYADRLLKSMVGRIEESHENIDYGFPIEKARECKTIMDMENLVIAPVFGFKDAWDYYKKTRTGTKLDRVGVPQYIIQSRDDPFFKGQTNPPNELHQPVRIQYTDHGGHCGYVFHETDDDSLETSWMPTELARFLKFVDETSFAESASLRYRLNQEASK